MPTDNPRVAAYLQPQTFKCLKTYCKENRLSISEGVGRILGEYFGVLPQELPSGTDWETRLAAVEQELNIVVDVAQRVSQNEDVIAQLQQSLSELLGQPLYSSLLTNSKTPSSSPSNTQETTSSISNVLQGTTPELSGLPSNLPGDIPTATDSTLTTYSSDTPKANSGQPNELPVHGKPDSDLLSELPSSRPKTDTVKLNELPISTLDADNKVPDELLGSPQENSAVLPIETLNIT